MVFFTCSYCGESIKKPSVAKHYQTACKNVTPLVTCVDCLKDFKGNEYEAHTKCFTEEERYSAKGFVPKASTGKGEKKQKAWSECVQGLLSSGTLKQDEKNLLGSICKHDNIPRKKGKFLNFLKSTARSYSDKTELIDRVWEKMENYFKNSSAAPQQNLDSNANEKKKKRKANEVVEDGDNDLGKKVKHSVEEVENGQKTGKNKKKNKKRPKVEEKKDIQDEPKSKKAKIQVNTNETTKEVGGKKKAKKEKLKENGTIEQTPETTKKTFDWADTIKKILSDEGVNNPVKLAKLQKKVLKKYGEVNGCEIDSKIIKRFSKKLNKMDSVVVNGDLVSLKS